MVLFGDINQYKDKSVPLISHPDQVNIEGVYFYNIDSRAIEGKSDPSYEFVQTAIKFALEKKIKVKLL